MRFVFKKGEYGSDLIIYGDSIVGIFKQLLKMVEWHDDFLENQDENEKNSFKVVENLIEHGGLNFDQANRFLTFNFNISAVMNPDDIKGFIELWNRYRIETVVGYTLLSKTGLSHMNTTIELFENMELQFLTSANHEGGIELELENKDYEDTGVSIVFDHQGKFVDVRIKKEKS